MHFFFPFFFISPLRFSSGRSGLVFFLIVVKTVEQWNVFFLFFIFFLSRWAIYSLNIQGNSFFFFLFSTCNYFLVCQSRSFRLVCLKFSERQKKKRSISGLQTRIEKPSVSAVRSGLLFTRDEGKFPEQHRLTSRREKNKQTKKLQKKNLRGTQMGFFFFFFL